MIFSQLSTVHSPYQLPVSIPNVGPGVEGSGTLGLSLNSFELKAMPFLLRNLLAVNGEVKVSDVRSYDL